jgi:hypothetical protein
MRFVAGRRVGTELAAVFGTVATGPAIMLAFGGSVVRVAVAVVVAAVAVASSEVCVLFHESGDQCECSDKFLIRGG